MTPADLEKALTILLAEQLADTDFVKKRVCNLRRKTNDCIQELSFIFTRDRGLPGNLYSLSIVVSFSFPSVDKLTWQFMGETYDPKWGTASRPLYTLVPSRPPSYRYCAAEPLEELAKVLSADFHTYALPFYEKYDTLIKLGSYFEQNSTQIISNRDFDIIKSHGLWCCKAAVFCVLEDWDNLKSFLDEPGLLSAEQKKRIAEYMFTNSVR